MSKIKIKGVTVKLSEDFFDNYFEKERRKLCRKKKQYFSQIKFTHYLASNKVKFVYPKKQKVNIKKYR